MSKGFTKVPVVVGCAESHVAECLEEMARLGATEAAVVAVGRGRSTVRGSYQEPVGAITSLRAGGWAAALGPGSPGHAVGWERRTAPAWFASDACVCLPWSSFDREQAATTIEIDPAGGFGAGGHPTTLLLLGEIRRRSSRPLGRVLDVGCGSGVLAVAAALHGATDVVAIDIERQAVSATNANAHRNGVAGLVNATTTPLADIDGQFDTVLANIHAHVVRDLAADLVGAMALGGRLGVSGISRAQESRLIAALRPLDLVDRSERDDWVALVLQASLS